MPSSRLDEIVANKRIELGEREKARPLDEWKDKVVPADGRFLKALKEKKRGNLIAEIKPKSPSAGTLKQELQLDQVLSAYDKYANAISVLTDEKYFGGSLSLLETVSQQSARPTLCKDFIISRYQCFEARYFKAQAVLLIVKILEQAQLGELYETITKLGMTAVVEVQTPAEMEIGLSVKPELILINNRNLTTFETDLATTEKLAPMVPPDVVLVSASGIENRGDIDRLSDHCNAFLIGSSLMRADDIAGKLAELAGVPVAQRGA
jgi:indole-3-glycerol phosphate synthase